MCQHFLHICSSFVEIFAIIAIKHAFVINLLLQGPLEALAFQHFPIANVNEWKIMFYSSIELELMLKTKKEMGVEGGLGGVN